MPTQEVIVQQRELLEAHRVTLFHYLRQQAILGTAHSQPGITHGILEARKSIKFIKTTLHSWGVDIEDLPHDEEIFEDIFQTPQITIPVKLKRLLDNLTGEKTESHWSESFHTSFNQFPVAYVPGKHSVNLASYHEIQRKLSMGIVNSEQMVRADHGTLAYNDINRDKWSKALLRDTLEEKIWIIAKDILTKNEAQFLDNIEVFRNTFVQNYRGRIHNEIGHYLSELDEPRFEQVLRHIVCVLYTVFHFKT